MKLSPEQRAEWVAALDGILSRTPVPIESREPSRPDKDVPAYVRREPPPCWSPSVMREHARARLCVLMTVPEPVPHTPAERRLRMQNVDHGVRGIRSLLVDDRAFDSAMAYAEALAARGLQ